MHSISESEGARLMAQWRATGGCFPEPETGETPSGDDGLAAVQFTTVGGGRICTDDGLQARRVTGWPFGTCGDDGLAATVPTPPFYCVPDEGLEAGSPTGMHIPGVCAGDGLTL